MPRGLRLAEVYVPIPATVDGPRAEPWTSPRSGSGSLHDGGGDVLAWRSMAPRIVTAGGPRRRTRARQS